MDRKEIIKAWLKSCNPTVESHRQAIERALAFMWGRQTNEEQQYAATSELNGVGFNGHDASFASSLMQGLDQWGRLTTNQARAAAKMLSKYSRQLAEMPPVNTTVNA